MLVATSQWIEIAPSSHCTPAWGQTASDMNALLVDGFGSLATADDMRRSVKLKLGYGLRGRAPVPGLVACSRRRTAARS